MTAPLTLPRLPGSGQVVNQNGSPAPGFLRWWNDLCSTIESAVNSISAVQVQIETILGIANSAGTSASAAATAAESASLLAGGTLADTALNTSYVSGITITASDAGANASIAVTSHTRTYGNGASVAVSSGNVTGLAYTTSYYLYYDQASRAGGTVTFAVATTIAAAGFSAANVNRHLVGTVVTPAALGASKTGFGVLPAGVTLPSGFSYA